MSFWKTLQFRITKLSQNLRLKRMAIFHSPKYDSIIVGTVRKCCAFPNKLIANVLEILYL